MPFSSLKNKLQSVSNELTAKLESLDGGMGTGGSGQNGYGQNGYQHQNGGSYNGHNGYAPPQGPPPGYGHQNGYAPPPQGYGYQDEYAPPAGPPPSHGGYAAPHQSHAESGKLSAHSSSQPSNLGFPVRFEAWTETSSNAETYIVIGQNKQPFYSAKMPSMSGRLTFTAGSRKEKGRQLGEAKDAGLSRSSAVITLPNGFSCNLAKSSTIKEYGKTYYTYTVPVDGRGEQTFVWHLQEADMASMLKGGGAGGWVLIRQGDDKQPLAKFSETTSMSLSSKAEMGTFEFLGEGATGSLGKTWATVTVLAIMKAKQKQIEKEIIKAMTEGAGG